MQAKRTASASTAKGSSRGTVRCLAQAVVRLSIGDARADSPDWPLPCPSLLTALASTSKATGTTASTPGASRPLADSGFQNASQNLQACCISTDPRPHPPQPPASQAPRVRSPG
jgi:hypothetical protein